MQIIGTTLYMAIFAVMSKHRDKFNSPFYIYLISIGVNDIIYLTYNGSIGGACILAGSCPFSEAENRFLTALLDMTTWFFELYSDMLLAGLYSLLCF